jgi:hypothetical protein
MMRRSNARRMPTWALRCGAIVLLFSTIGCSGSSFRSTNGVVVPLDGRGSTQPKANPSGQVSAAQSGASPPAKTADSSVVTDVPSPRIEQQTNSRDSFLQSMIAADLKTEKQQPQTPAPLVEQTSIQGAELPTEIQTVQPPPTASAQPAQKSFFDGLLEAGLAAGSLFSSLGQTTTTTTKPATTPPTSTQAQQCPRSSSAAAPRAVDVVFNIDVSTSMNPYIQIVKENVIAFASALERQGLNARVAAVGFVDEPLQSIDFAHSSAFQSILSGWRTIENGNFDTQEGGQSSLGHALWMLSAPEVGARAGAAKVIIHISDALAFAGENHNDFSVTQLSATFRAARSQFGSLLFFDSVPTTPGETGPWVTRKQVSLSPRMQMNDLRQQSQNLGGSPLQFPFSASAMTLDLPQGIQSGLALLQGCK